MVEAAQNYVPLFIDTLHDHVLTQRFKESYGSYPVLRVLDPSTGEDRAVRIDTNPTAGRVDVLRILDQLKS